MDPELRDILGRFERYFELIQQQFERVDGRLDSMQAQQDRMQAQQDRMQAQLDRMQAQLDRMQAQLDGMQVQLDGMQVRMDGMQAQIDRLQLEMTERFISVDEQLRTLALRVQLFEESVQRDLGVLRDQVSQLNERMTAVETAIVGVHGRIDRLSDDMRQRFRAVNDRLVVIEKRTAA